MRRELEPPRAASGAAPPQPFGLRFGHELDAAGSPPPSLQLEPLAAHPAAETAGSMRETARFGTSGPRAPFPYLDTIQRTFGRHDLSGVEAHLGPAAALGASALRAKAFTFGDAVAFGRPPTLFTAAHEAAHVVQQRARPALSAGIGRAGDVYERHADSVAARVAQGLSAEALLDRLPPAGSLDRSQPGTGHGEPALQLDSEPEGKTPAAEPEPAQPVADAGRDDERAKADSIYNKVVNAWSSLAQKQVRAIGSLYTEAQKPQKPTLAQELLISLAEAALAGALGGIGGLVAMAIEKKIASVFVSRALANRPFRDSLGRFITKEAGVKAATESSKNTAKFVSEFAKDAMKDGVKSLARPRIRAVLSSAGKSSVDAFFEGQMEAAGDAGKLGSDAAEDRRQDVLGGDNPVHTAQIMFEAMNDIYVDAALVQKDETLKHWLIYMASAELGTVPEGGQAAGSTNLAKRTEPWLLGSYTPGVLYVFVNRDLRVRRAVLGNSTAHYVALLEDQPIKQLKVPVVVQLDFPGIDDFYINVNEKGALWLEPSGGGAGNALLRRHGGAQLSMVADARGYGVNVWIGGDPFDGARYLWNNVIGVQKLRSLLEPTK
jgi:hypothetical protein